MTATGNWSRRRALMTTVRPDTYACFARTGRHTHCVVAGRSRLPCMGACYASPRKLAPSTIVVNASCLDTQQSQSMCNTVHWTVALSKESTRMGSAAGRIRQAFAHSQQNLARALFLHAMHAIDSFLPAKTKAMKRSGKTNNGHHHQSIYV